MRAPRIRELVCVAAFLGAACSDVPYPQVRVEEGNDDPARASERGPELPTLRFSVAGIESPRDTYVAYARLFERVGALLGRRSEFVQRPTYRQLNDMLAARQLDAAIVCTGGYLDLRARFPSSVEVLAVPVVKGRTAFRSLVLVPAGSGATELKDLAGKRFAFTDELSLSGRLYVLSLLRRERLDPDRFFASVILTQSHDRAVAAVAKGLVDGAAVNSLVYEHLLGETPSLAGQVRVLHRSPELGGFPVVVSTDVPAALRARLRELLLGLHHDREAAAAMRLVDIERFVVPAPGLFDAGAAVVGASR